MLLCSSLTKSRALARRITTTQLRVVEPAFHTSPNPPDDEANEAADSPTQDSNPEVDSDPDPRARDHSRSETSLLPRARAPCSFPSSRSITVGSTTIMTKKTPTPKPLLKRTGKPSNKVVPRPGFRVSGAQIPLTYTYTDQKATGRTSSSTRATLSPTRPRLSATATTASSSTGASTQVVREPCKDTD